MLGLAALAFALWQVLSRYFFPQQSISYAEEVIVYLLIWAIMIVSSQLVRTDSHVRPDLVLNVVPAGVARWMEIFNCVAAIVFCGALAWYGWQIVEIAMADRRAQRLGSALSDVDLLCGAAGRRRADVDPLCHQAGRACRVHRSDGMLPRQPGGHELPGIRLSRAMTGFLTLFVGLLAAGMPVFLVLGLCAGAMFVASGQPLVGAAQLVINELNSPTLMALPLFVMAAAFMRFGGIAKALVRSGGRLARRSSGIARTRHRRRLHAVRRNLRLERRDRAGDGDDPDPGDDRARLSASRSRSASSAHRERSGSSFRRALP